MIRNTTRRKILADKHRSCESMLSKGRGLMFTFRMKESLVFPFVKEQKIPLHMFFVFYPIDVLWLDSDLEVVEVKERFRPFTFYHPQKDAGYVIELPEGTIKESGTKIGDKIAIVGR